MFSKVSFRSRFHAKASPAPGNNVAIHRKNLRLGEMAFNLDSQERLADFSLEGFLWRQKKPATQLLGQCAGALGLAPFKDVHNRRTNNAQDINAEVALKMAVFNRDNGFAKDGRNLIVSHHHPSLQRKAADHGTVAGIKLRRNVGPKIKKLTDLRQVGGIHKDQTRERPRTNCQKN